MPRYHDDNGNAITERSLIEVYYTWKQLDDSIIEARREQLKKLREPATKTVSDEPKTVSQFKLEHEALAKEFYGFAKKHSARLTSTKMICKLKNGDQSSSIAFNVYHEDCTIYGIGNIGSILMQAKSLFSAVDKPIVKLSTLKERLDEMTLELRRTEFEIERQTKQVTVLRCELHSKETKALNLEELPEEEKEEMELELSELNKREIQLMHRLQVLSRGAEKLRIKIPELTREIEERMENGGKPVAVQISPELQFVQKIIRLMNGWNRATFTFLDALNAHANTFQPVEEKDDFLEELKKQDVVLNIRAPREPRPTAPVVAAAPVVAVPVVAVPVVAVVAAPVVAAAPQQPVRTAPQKPQQQQKPARPTSSRLARLGLKKP
jgi:hypothetical protein